MQDVKTERIDARAVKVKIFVPSLHREVVAGVKTDKGVFVKFVTDPKQKLFKPPGYALDERVYQWILTQRDITQIMIREKFSGADWLAPVATWQDKGFLIDRGQAGKQFALPIGYMTYQRSDGKQLFPLYGKEHKHEYARVGEFRRCVHCGEFPPVRKYTSKAEKTAAKLKEAKKQPKQLSML